MRLHILVLKHVEYTFGMLVSVFAAEDLHQKREERQVLHRVDEDALKHFERGKSSRLCILVKVCQRT